MGFPRRDDEAVFVGKEVVDGDADGAQQNRVLEAGRRFVGEEPRPRAERLEDGRVAEVVLAKAEAAATIAL